MHFLSVFKRNFLCFLCITVLSGLLFVAFHAYAEGKFCCEGTPEECCATKGKIACPDEGDYVCRTKCLGLQYHKCETAQDNWLCPVDHECGEVIGECSGISMVCEACEKHVLAANMSWASAFACKTSEYCDAHGCHECPANATCDGRDFACAPWSSWHPSWGECAYFACGESYELRFYEDGSSICVCIDEYVCGEECCYGGQYCNDGKCLSCPKNATCDDRQDYTCIEGHSINADETACCPDGVEHLDEGGKSVCCEEGNDFVSVMGKANRYTCCPTGQKAYWDGTKAVCCTGIPSSVVGVPGKYVCCAGESGEKWQAFNTGGGNHSCCEVGDSKRVVRLAGTVSEYICCDNSAKIGYGNKLCCNGTAYNSDPAITDIRVSGGDWKCCQYGREATKFSTDYGDIRICCSTDSETPAFDQDYSRPEDVKCCSNNRVYTKDGINRCCSNSAYSRPVAGADGDSICCAGLNIPAYRNQYDQDVCCGSAAAPGKVYKHDTEDYFICCGSDKSYYSAGYEAFWGYYSTTWFIDMRAIKVCSPCPDNQVFMSGACYSCQEGDFAFKSTNGPDNGCLFLKYGFTDGWDLYNPATQHHGVTDEGDWICPLDKEYYADVGGCCAQEPKTCVTEICCGYTMEDYSCGEYCPTGELVDYCMAEGWCE